MTGRSLYYWSKLYSSQLKKGQEYRTINKTVAINILNFDHLKEMDKYHNCFLLKEKETNQILTDLEEIHFIELTKIDESKYQDKKQIDNDLLPWLLFLKNPKSEVVKMIEKRVKELKEAAETLEVLSQDEETRELYEARQKAIHDHVSNIEEAKREGKKEGIKEGKGLGMATLIEMQLVNKFKSIPDEYRKRLRELSEDKLKKIGSKIFEMEEFKELEDYFD